MSHQPTDVPVPTRSATTRLGLAPAPAGLGLVQDLLNTRDIGGKVPDLLTTVGQARQWLPAELGDDDQSSEHTWALAMTERDVEALRHLRRELLTMVRGDDPGAVQHEVPASLVVTPSGELRLEPAGTGRQRVISHVWREVFLAQRADTWKRLKLCHNPPCSSAFYDRSKNNSGVWHDVKTCGNAVNLRASRARKRGE